MAQPPPKSELHQIFIEALGDSVVTHGDLEDFPLEIELEQPLPSKVRLYIYNVTSPPGGRPTGEHKTQLIVPDQDRGERGSFDHSDGRFVLLTGYSKEADVFVLWDAGLHHEFSYSKNVQVKAKPVYEAVAGEIGTQTRNLRSGKETVITANRANLAEAIQRRVDTTIERLTEK